MDHPYVLTEFKPIGLNGKKKQIILTETKRDYRNYINSLIYRYNKKNPYLPNYVVTKSGEIYKIMEPENYSLYMGVENVDKDSIIIAIENLGWLKKNPIESSYVNWIGDIYKKDAFEKKWRDHLFWDPYNEEQIIETSKLIIELCNKFDIPKKCIGDNVRHEGIENYRGVTTRSNFDFIHKDVNPSFDFKLLKKLIENDEPV